MIAQPTGYYNACEGKYGDALKATLHNIIKGHVEFFYTDVWNILQQSDEDPSNPDNIMLIYTDCSQDKYFREVYTLKFVFFIKFVSKLKIIS